MLTGFDKVPPLGRGDAREPDAGRSAALPITEEAWAQIKIYGLKEHLDPIKSHLSNVVHSCVVDALQFPPEKRAHRFFPMEVADFYYPRSASPKYTIIELSMFEGRSVETKKSLIRLLFERVVSQ